MLRERDGERGRRQKKTGAYSSKRSLHSRRRARMISSICSRVYGLNVSLPKPNQPAKKKKESKTKEQTLDKERPPRERSHPLCDSPGMRRAEEKRREKFLCLHAEATKDRGREKQRERKREGERETHTQHGHLTAVLQTQCRVYVHCKDITREREERICAHSTPAQTRRDRARLLPLLACTRTLTQRHQKRTWGIRSPCRQGVKTESDAQTTVTSRPDAQLQSD